MKGLLKKDLYESVTTLRSVFLILLVFGGVACLSPKSAMFLPYFVVLPGAAATSLINVEEKTGWMLYGGAFPFRRRVFIAEKYLYCLISVAVGALLVTLIYFSYELRGAGSVNLAEIFFQYLGIGLFAPALLLPCAYKFGAEKGRYIVMAIIIVTIVFVMNRTDSRTVSLFPVDVPAWTFVLAAAALLFISFLVTVKIYDAKEITA